MMLVNSVLMTSCPRCHQPATKRDGYDRFGRQRCSCRPCGRDFTAYSASTFSGYRWPPDVILMAVRWYCSLPLSAAQVVRLLAERNIDVSPAPCSTGCRPLVPSWLLRRDRSLNRFAPVRNSKRLGNIIGRIFSLPLSRCSSVGNALQGCCREMPTAR